MAEADSPPVDTYVERLLRPQGITEQRGDFYHTSWKWDEALDKVQVDFHPTSLDPEIVRWRIPGQMLVEYLDDGKPISDEHGEIHLYPLAVPAKIDVKDNLRLRYGKHRLALTMGMILCGVDIDKTPLTIYLAVNPKHLYPVYGDISETVRRQGKP